MKGEIHLFIMWENARNKQKEILEDIDKSFGIINVYEMEWSEEKFSENLSRFYGTNLPKGSHKEKHCGTGKFVLVIVNDKEPKYEERTTSKGVQKVNINMFDKKEQYRKLTGGGHKIHATNSEIETNHDLTLLFGKNIQKYLEENHKQWNGNIKELKLDLIGCNGWKTVEDMFYALNNCARYAILRNYESLPEEIYVNEHNDIDLICESKEDTAYILNAKPVHKENYRVQYIAKLEERNVYFDLRYIGDNYYDEKMEKDILENRILNKKGFYTLNLENYFYTLLYHALIQKLDFVGDYKHKLEKMNIEKVDINTTLNEYTNILKKWMIKNEYIMVEPNDKSVIFNLNMVEYFKPLIYRQVEIDEYKNKINLLSNENEILNKKIEDLTKLLEGIQDSRTWKITKPIRYIKNIFKK